MRLISKIIIPFVAFAILLLAFIVGFARQSLRSALFRNEFFAIQESVASEAATHLQASDFADPRSADAARHFLDFAEGVTDSTTARVTIWDKGSTIIYSDLASIVGARSEGRPGLVGALATGKAAYHEQKRDDEKPMQTDVGEFLDIYVPVAFAGQVAGVVEVHSVIGAVLLPIQRQVNDISVLLVAGTLLFVGVLYLIAQHFIGRPLRKVDAFVSGVERGDFRGRLDIRSKDEIGKLGGELNRMAGGLQRLQELKNEFVFIASHELRSPISAIKGYLSLIQESAGFSPPEDVRRYLENATKANDRLVQLVDDILDIARSESGKLNVSVAVCDLSEAVDAVVREQKVLADAKRITVAYARPEKPAKVLADDVRLKEVLVNLVSNAIKYSPEGAAITISHQRKNGGVVTNVRDSGFGIPAKDQAHVFEKFFRADEGRRKGIPGTGLGLFITKQLVEKMNGKIWFSSAEGKGSTFSFSLKAAPGAS